MALQNSLPPSPLSYFIMMVVKLRSYEGWASMSHEAGGGGSEPRDTISNGCWKDDGPFVRFKLAKVKAIGYFF